jgi:hypothetical protein
MSFMTENLAYANSAKIPQRSPAYLTITFDLNQLGLNDILYCFYQMKDFKTNSMPLFGLFLRTLVKIFKSEILIFFLTTWL